MKHHEDYILVVNALRDFNKRLRKAERSIKTLLVGHLRRYNREYARMVRRKDVLATKAKQRLAKWTRQEHSRKVYMYEIAAIICQIKKGRHIITVTPSEARKLRKWLRTDFRGWQRP